MANPMIVDSAVGKIKTIIIDRICRSCGFTHQDKMPLMPGRYEITEDPDRIACPRCYGDFPPKFTEEDTKWYPNNAPIPKTQGKKRVIILDGKCECGFGYSKREFMSEPLKPGEKDWAPTTHNQKCPQCNKEYYLDWTETERTYL